MRPDAEATEKRLSSLLMHALEADGHQVVEAADGRRLLECLAVLFSKPLELDDLRTAVLFLLRKNELE